MRVLGLLMFGALPLIACGIGEAPPSALTVSDLRSRAALAYSDWSAPVALGPAINTTFNEQAPTLSPHGESLYFCSNRPGGIGGNDIWVSRRDPDTGDWSTAVNLGAGVNSTGGDCGPNVSADGHLLFLTSNRGGGPNDIYVAWRFDVTDDLAWEAPVRLGPGVSSPLFEFSPFYQESAEEGRANFYFERGTSNVATDIFAGAVRRTGETMGPSTAVTELNSTGAEGHPTLRFDAREVFIHSNRDGINFDIWVSERPNVLAEWSAPVKVAALNTTPLHEIHPSLSRDGQTIFFVRGIGVANDIWMATRTLATP